jgi:uncharacterized protein YndB with AHSA1/START domain
MKREAAPRVDVRVTQRYGAAPERVFDAWIDPALAGQWLFATASQPAESVAIDARTGGTFRFAERRRGARMTHTGVYLEVDRPRRIVFTLPTLANGGAARRVRVAIVPLEKGCELTLVHENLLPDEACGVEGRWSGMLYGLGQKLAGTPGTHASSRAAGTRQFKASSSTRARRAGSSSAGSRQPPTGGRRRR